MTHGTKNIAVCLPQESGVMSVPGTIVTTECKIGGEIGVVTDEEMIAGITGHVIGGHQKIAVDPITHSGMRKGITRGTTKGITKRVAKIAPTPNEGMIEDTTHKGHHKHRAMMRPETIKQKCRSTACLSKLRVTCDVVTPD
ncbi:MAG: hypothetical protein ACPGUZ_01950 [Holosporaceae bacterium]